MLSIAATPADTGAMGTMGTTGAAGATGTASSAATPQPRLVKAAHEFEAQMMQELLKPMTAGNGLDGEDNDTASGSGGALGAFASEAFARGLSEHGGFGIASSIVRQLTPSSNTQVTAQVTGNLHGNTVIRTNK
jgi:Rod binding domain-containing protein